jgi:magnesium/cobalt transport protein CorA
LQVDFRRQSANTKREKSKMKILTYLYDADGTDRKIDLEEDTIGELNDKQLLWVNILERDEETVKQVTRTLNLDNVPIKGILRTTERPKIYKFKDYYHFFIVSVEMDEENRLRRIPIDFIVGENFVITVHEGDVNYLQEFAKRERGENNIGELDTESFVGTMLDLHIVSYFRVLEDIEATVDRLDTIILKRDLKDEDFLNQMVRLRGDVSRLRRWFLPHRDIFYQLSRPDFKQIAESDSFENFQALNQHFESAVVAIESARDTVLSLFDLFTTKSSHNMNNQVRRLTFVTLIVGGLGVIAGVWGMNFEVGYFKWAEVGFWWTMVSMGAYVLGAILLGKFLRWF